jgi:hypothetical protein
MRLKRLSVAGFRGFNTMREIEFTIGSYCFPRPTATAKRALPRRSRFSSTPIRYSRRGRGDRAIARGASRGWQRHSYRDQRLQ